ncbi:MAG: uracil-DNA glycosylase [Shimia sp.]
MEPTTARDTVHDTAAGWKWHAARAALDWQVEAGVDCAIGEAPIDRYAPPEAPAPEARPTPVGRAGQATRAGAAPPSAARIAPAADPVAEAEAAAAAAPDLPALAAAMDAFEHCPHKRGAKTLVFADGVPGAPLMIVGEAPGREEDRAGRPFVGAAGDLLDRMLTAIGRDRGRDAYATLAMPWRPAGNRDPDPADIAMMAPFLRRHVALARPRVLVAMGDVALRALLGRSGIARLRGTWQEVEGLPCLPMRTPAHLLRQPAAKREAWADLLAIQERLRADVPSADPVP